MLSTRECKKGKKKKHVIPRQLVFVSITNSEFFFFLQKYTFALAARVVIPELWNIFNTFQSSLKNQGQCVEKLAFFYQYNRNWSVKTNVSVQDSTQFMKCVQTKRLLVRSISHAIFVVVVLVCKTHINCGKVRILATHKLLQK